MFRPFQLGAAACVFLTTFVNLSLAAEVPCYSGIYTLMARGTQEPQGEGRLETIISALNVAIPGSGSDQVIYPANQSFWSSVAVGVPNAQQQLQDYTSRCPGGKIVVMGYSQGAYVMSLALAGGDLQGQSITALSSDVGENIIAVVFFGDPSRVPGQGTEAEGSATCQVGSPLQRTGSSVTAMQAYADRLEDWCGAGDPICCKTGTNITVHLSYNTTANLETVVKYVQGKVANSTYATASSTTSTMSSTSSPSSTSASSSPTATPPGTTTLSQTSTVATESLPTASTLATFSSVPSASAKAVASTNGVEQTAPRTLQIISSICMVLFAYSYI